MAWNIDDGDFSIHGKRVSQLFSVTSKADPDPHLAARITSSYSEEAEEAKDYWQVTVHPRAEPGLMVLPFLGSPLKNVTDMPPPASKKSSKLRESSITRESSNAPSMDNESRMSVFSPEATPVSPASSIDGPSTASVRVTNGKNNQKSGATNSISATSAAPSQSSVHDANYMIMGKQYLRRTPVRTTLNVLPDYDDNETGSSTDSDSD